MKVLSVEYNLNKTYILYREQRVILSVEHNLNKTYILYREQRVTALVVGILSGLSVFMTKILRVLFLAN